MKFGCEKNFSAECKKNLEHSEKFSKATNKARFCLAFLIKIFQTNEIWL
jgi:hypothetical protein